MCPLKFVVSLKKCENIFITEHCVILFFYEHKLETAMVVLWLQGHEVNHYGFSVSLI